MYKSEGEMYPHVAQWLRHLLTQKFEHSTVVVEDTSKKVLSRFLVERGLHELFPEYQTFEIQVDVTGVVYNGKTAGLAFIECKLDKMSLRDLSQLLGYSRVATPIVSIMVSPEGISDAINLLFNTHRRYDILSYGDKGCIRIAKWDENKRDINMQTLVPRGRLF